MNKKTNRIVLVTGAASGIGLETARAFSRVGDTVVLSDRNGELAAAEAEKIGPDHWGIGLDVSDESSVAGGVNSVVDRFGRIDVLINNAGIVDPKGTPAIDKDLEEVEYIMRVNLDGCYSMSKAVGKIMLSQGEGAIVNVASMAGVQAIPGRTAYSMSKAAVLGLTRSLACEWAIKGIRVNAVLPGYVATDIVRSLVANGQVDLDQVTRRIPLGRMAEAKEIAEPVVWAASNTYLSGSMIVADGGYHAFGGTGAASTHTAPSTVLPESPVVVVTGGASGIGASIVKHYSENGAQVVILDLNSNPQNPETDNQHYIEVDITDYQAVKESFEKIQERFGQLNVLVNCAAIADSFIPTSEQTLEDFQKSISVNLMGTFAVTQASAKIMKKNGGGAIVNLASIAAFGGLPTRNSYCAAKNGIAMMTRNLACEWAASGIRVNAVAPGYIATPGVQALSNRGDINTQTIRRRTPMGRLGNPEEITDAVAFLASEQASYLTGSVCIVDGGWSAYGDAGDAVEID